MSRIRVALGLVLLLVFAQQGAMLHELSHVYRTGSAGLQNEETLLDGKLCETCIAFSQVANPASSSLFVPPAVVTIRHVSSGPEYTIIAAGALAPRSRGPPILL
jgi:hypothetical protein